MGRTSMFVRGVFMRTVSHDSRLIHNLLNVEASGLGHRAGGIAVTQHSPFTRQPRAV